MVEGVNVINEAIQFLAGLKPLPPLHLDPLLCQSAKEHVNDIGPKGLLSYQSSDGTEPEDRISKYGNYVEALGENIDFGPNDALGVIVSLTLDDGEDERPHRDNLFKADYKKVGIACGSHKTEYNMCVMDFAYDFLPLGEEEVEDQQPILQENQNKVINNNQVKIPQNQPQINNYSNPPLENSHFMVQKQINMSNAPIQQNQSPIVNVNIENKSEVKNSSGVLPQSNQIVNTQNNQNFQKQQDQTNSFNEISSINSKKKIVSKYIEITTKIVYSYEDGTKKETIEKVDHLENY